MSRLAKPSKETLEDKLGVKVETNFGGILKRIEAKEGEDISTSFLSREMPISYTQAMKIRRDEIERFDAKTLIKFIAFCRSFGVTVTPNDIFKFNTVAEAA